MTVKPATIRVTPVLFCAPVFWYPTYWSESTYAWDWVRPELPVEEKPVAEFEVSLDAALGEVIDAACDAWDIKPGRYMIEHHVTRQSQFTRFAFVVAGRDPYLVADEDRYEWPDRLPAARETGEVEQVPGLEITYRELLASSSLGLIEGDVTKPYVDPVIPQGEFGHVLEYARLTVEAIKGAYSGVDDTFGYVEHTIRLISRSLPEVDRTADHVIDEGIRIGALYAFYRWMRRRLRRRRRRAHS